MDERRFFHLHTLLLLLADDDDADEEEHFTLFVVYLRFLCVVSQQQHEFAYPEMRMRIISRQQLPSVANLSFSLSLAETI
jgi:hypothetical protein